MSDETPDTPAGPEPASRPQEVAVPAAVGGVTGALLTIVATIRSWRQVGVLLVLGGAGLLGTLIYQGRDRLLAALEAFLAEPPQIAMAGDDVAARTATALAEQLAPVAIVVIWRVDLRRNRRVIVGLVLQPTMEEVAADIHLGTVGPLFVRVPGANMLTIGALDGEVACGRPFAGAWTDVAQEVVDRLLPSTCVIGVPPTPEALVGMIAVGFGKPLDPARQAAVSAALRTVAEVLVVHR